MLSTIEGLAPRRPDGCVSSRLVRYGPCPSGLWRVFIRVQGSPYRENRLGRRSLMDRAPTGQAAGPLTAHRSARSLARVMDLLFSETTLFPVQKPVPVGAGFSGG